MRMSFKKVLNTVGMACAVSVIAVACGKKLSTVTSEAEQNREEVPAESNSESNQAEQPVGSDKLEQLAKLGTLETSSSDRGEPPPADLSSVPKATIPSEFEIPYEVVPIAESDSEVQSLGLVTAAQRTAVPERRHLTGTNGSCLVKVSASGCTVNGWGLNRWVDITNADRKLSSKTCMIQALNTYRAACPAMSNPSSVVDQYLSIIYRKTATESVEHSWHRSSHDCNIQLFMPNINQRKQRIEYVEKKNHLDTYGKVSYDLESNIHACARRAYDHLVYWFNDRARCSSTFTTQTIASGILEGEQNLGVSHGSLWFPNSLASCEYAADRIKMRANALVVGTFTGAVHGAYLSKPSFVMTDAHRVEGPRE